MQLNEVKQACYSLARRAADQSQVVLKLKPEDPRALAEAELLRELARQLVKASGELVAGFKPPKG